MDNFDKWYARSTARGAFFWFECNLSTSPLRAARRAAPHSMLYFLILVLQRLVHEFWDTAHLNDYVKRCAELNGRCPPSVIALRFYRNAQISVRTSAWRYPERRGNAYATAKLRVQQRKQRHHQLQDKRQQLKMQRKYRQSTMRGGRRLQKTS